MNRSSPPVLRWQPYSTTSLRQRTTFTFKALFDTEDYDGAISAAQKTCATALAQPWLAVNSHLMTPKTMDVTAPGSKFLELRSRHSHGFQNQQVSQPRMDSCASA